MQRSKFIIAVLSLACLLLTSCVANVAYRQKESVLTPKPLHPHDGQKPYKLAFIEFDDLGELFDRTELTRCLEAIHLAKKNSLTGEAIVVVFVHGWKNNASDKSGNVWGFQEELEEISDRAVSGDTPVVGVYLGWRGNVTNLPFAQDLTFWNRRDAAMRIPHAHITETVHRIVNETKSTTGTSSGSSICILVGHSFGGMVLERALTQSIVSLVLREEGTDKGVQKLADLVVLVNEAAPATESKQFLDMLRTDNVKVTDQNGKPAPLLLSITSKGDLATGLAMPLGQYPSLLAKSPRVYDNPDPPSEKKQSTYYLHTTANMGVLQSHVIGRPTDSEVQQAMQGGGHEYKRFRLGTVEYVIVTKNRETTWNTTPYWVMQMPVEFVPDHSTIFRPAFRQLLQQFLPASEDLKQPGKRVPMRVAIPNKPAN